MGYINKMGYTNKISCTDGIDYVGKIGYRANKVKIWVSVVVYKIGFSVILVLVLVLAKLFLRGS